MTISPFAYTLPRMADDLVPLTDEALKSLTLEVEVMHDGDNVEATRKLFERALPQAARQIVNAALFSEDEKTRVANSKFIVEQVLGKDKGLNTGKDTPFGKLYAAVVEADRKAS